MCSAHGLRCAMHTRFARRGIISVDIIPQRGTSHDVPLFQIHFLILFIQTTILPDHLHRKRSSLRWNACSRKGCVFHSDSESRSQCRKLGSSTKDVKNDRIRSKIKPDSGGRILVTQNQNKVASVIDLYDPANSCFRPINAACHLYKKCQCLRRVASGHCGRKAGIHCHSPLQLTCTDISAPFIPDNGFLIYNQPDRASLSGTSDTVTICDCHKSHIAVTGYFLDHRRENPDHIPVWQRK